MIAATTADAHAAALVLGCVAGYAVVVKFLAAAAAAAIAEFRSCK